MNKIVANAMSGVTCGMRFPGQLNSGLRKAAVNLIIFPRMHFLTLASAPYSSRVNSASDKVSSLIETIFDYSSTFAELTPKEAGIKQPIIFSEDKLAQVKYNKKLVK